MKLLSILSFAGGTVLLVLAITIALTRGLGALDVTVFDVYFVVRPLYLLMISAVLLVAGWLTLAHPIP
jgi:hypothetical protein